MECIFGNCGHHDGPCGWPDLCSGRKPCGGPPPPPPPPHPPHRPHPPRRRPIF